MDYNEYDKERARNVRISQLLGVKDRGIRFAVKCPFHKNGHERNPSLSIYPDNSYHCYTCDAHGNNAIDFCLELGYTFKQTMLELVKY